MSRTLEQSRTVWREPELLDDERIALTEWPLLSALLHARGISDTAAATTFLSPRKAPLADPLLLRDMEQAVAMLRAAIERGDRIGIFGDYDVDGITSTAMLTRALRRRGATVIPMIPHRKNDGYGVTPQSVERILSNDIQFLITVDCGSSSPNEFAALHEHGVDAIILDHHNISGVLPDTCAFVSPKRPDNHAAFTELAAVGVAHALIRALIGDEAAEMYLPYVALGAVADVVELVGDNRTLVARGLSALRRWKLPGMIALCQSANIDQATIGTFEIGYVLGPRINAAGRMDDPQLALDLLLADDLATAAPLAGTLNGLNERRQADTRRVIDEAHRMILDAGGIDGFPAIVLADPGWSTGIAGIVAGRLAEAYNRPAVVMELGVEESRGSARTSGGIDIHAALQQSRPLLTRFGGHSAAAGLSLRSEHLEQLQRELSATVFDLSGGRLPDRVLELDAEVTHDDLDLSTVDLLSCLEPFGLGNAQPFLLIPHVRHRFPKTSKDGKHLLFQVIDDRGRSHRTVMFGAGHRLDELRSTPRIDLAAHLTRDDWSGRSELKLRVTDFRPTRA